MKHLSIAARIYLIIGLSSLFSLAVIVFQITSIGARYEEMLSNEIRQQERARQLEVTFKQQVQEWKDILLRGSDPQLLDKHQKLLADRQQAVRGLLQELRQTVTDPETRSVLDQFAAQYRHRVEGFARQDESAEAGRLAQYAAAIDTAVSRGVDAPRSSPAGERSAAGDTPASRSCRRRAAWVRREPRAPTYAKGLRRDSVSRGMSNLGSCVITHTTVRRSVSVAAR